MSLPVVEYLKLPEGGEPYLEGHKCSPVSYTHLTLPTNREV